MSAEQSPAPPSAQNEITDFRDLAFKVSDEQLEQLIERYTRDVTKYARLGKFDPVIGR